MRIDELRIDGFGHFRDASLAFGPQLTVVFGPNEAGKSTLLGFVRSALFGFERRNAPGRYELGAGPYGGELLLHAGKGPLTVRRMGGRKVEGDLSLRGPGGEPLPLSRLTDALQGVSKELFCQVFAFGLDELATFEALAKEGQVAEALFAAGMQGAKNLLEVTAQLTKSSEELFKPSGRKQRLNQVLSRLEEVRQELTRMGDRPQRYFHLLEERDRREAEAGELERRLGELRRDRAGVEALLQAAPQLAVLERLAKEIAQLPESLAHFPEDGVARLEAALARGREGAQREAGLQKSREQAGAELAKLEATLIPEPAVDALRAGREALGARLGTLRALPGRKAQVEARQARAHAAVDELGLGLEPEALLQVDVGAGAKGQLASLAARLEGASGELKEWERRAWELSQRQAELAAERARREEERAKLTGEDVQTLKARLKALERLPALEGEAERLRAQAEGLRQDLAELGGREGSWTADPVPGWWVGLALMVSVVAGAVAWPLLGPGAAVAAWVLGGLVTAGLFALRQRLSKAQARAADDLRERAARQKAARAQKEEALARAEAELDRTKAEREAKAAELGIPEDGDRARAIRERQAAVEARVDEAVRREALDRDLGDLQARLGRLQTEVEGAMARVDQAKAVHAEARAAWAAFLGGRHLPEGLEPAAAQELLQAVAQAQRELRETAEQADQLRAEEADLAGVVDRFVKAARDAGVGAEGEAVERLYSLTAGIVEERARIVEKLEGLRREQARLLAERDRARMEVAQAEADKGALLAAYEARDEEAFRHLAQRARQRAEWVSEERAVRAPIEASSHLFAGVGPGGDPVQTAQQMLREAGGAQALEARRAALVDDLARAEARQKELAEARGALRTELAALETDDQMTALREEEERLIAQARTLARAYAKDRLGLALLARAREAHEASQQPRVVQLASAHFAQLTGFRYKRVLIPTGERTLRVVDAQGQDKGPDQLSRGTREQLYLAFRLAVVEDFGDARGPLPVLLDDILVNFDAARARSAVKALARLAVKHQVIAFTCHGWLSELYAQNGAKVVSLDEVEGVEGLTRSG